MKEDKIRIITMASSDGSLDKERVVFTEDFKAPAKDWLEYGMEVTSDTVKENILPDCFPYGHTLCIN